MSKTELETFVDEQMADLLGLVGIERQQAIQMVEEQRAASRSAE